MSGSQTVAAVFENRGNLMSMHKFKRNSLTLALVAAIGSVGIAGTASAAVHLSDNDQGQVLIYPYYTTRAGHDTYLSVLNTSALSKALKVRFYEGKNGRDVLNFNVYLSPYDIWTAAIVNTANGAKIITADHTCTAPAIPAGGKEFVNFAYSGPAIEGIQRSGSRYRTRKAVVLFDSASWALPDPIPNFDTGRPRR